MVRLLIGIFIIAISGVGAWLGWNLASEGWKEFYQNQESSDFFFVNSGPSIISQWPGPLFYLAPNKIISPITFALFIEVVNNKHIITRITDVKCKALIKYDEGDKIDIITTKDGGSKFTHKPTGKIVEKWRKLYDMGFLGDQVYYVINNDFAKCKRIDFRHNSFDELARNQQLKPGQSIMGWIFFEVEKDLRGRNLEFKEIELTLTNSAGDVQTFQHNVKGKEDISAAISGGELHLFEGFYDFTKENFTLAPKRGHLQ